jgi:hypothetical protein
MKPLGLTQYRLAQDLGVTPIRISQIGKGERSISNEAYSGTLFPICRDLTGRLARLLRSVEQIN